MVLDGKCCHAGLLANRIRIAIKYIYIRSITLHHVLLIVIKKVQYVIYGIYFSITLYSFHISHTHNLYLLIFSDPILGIGNKSNTIRLPSISPYMRSSRY